MGKFTKWQRILYQPCVPMGEDGRLVTASPAHIALSRRAATEGMVLLKNNNDLLPLKTGARIALFGVGSADYVRGGGGSGEVTTAYTHNLIDAVNDAAARGDVSVYKPLNDFYSRVVTDAYHGGAKPGCIPEAPLPDGMLKDAAAFADTAIVSICRFSGEGADRKGEPGDGDFYLDEAENRLITDVTAAFPHTVLVLNVGGMVDTSYFRENDRIEAVLLAWQAGLEGGYAEWDILSGAVTPSGRLVDTFAATFADYPSSANFNESEEYAEYTDDIYVGYRYFETIPGAAAHVNYPFGYGLSYTTFSLENVSAAEAQGVITLVLRVTNTGSTYAGKETVQAYFSAPAGKLGKPKYVLAAFAKTETLAPGESRLVRLTFPVSDMASFDDTGVVCRSARVLEAGDYTVYTGTSVRELTPAMTYTVKKDTVVEQLHAYVSPKKLSKRLRADGSYETLKVTDYPAPAEDTAGFPEKTHWNFEYLQLCRTENKRPEGLILLADVASGKATLDAFLAQLNDADLIDLVSGAHNTGVADTHGFGGIDYYGIPNAMTCDGPAGMRVWDNKGVVATAWPCATLLACTWNTALVEEIGRAGAREVKENNMAIWLTPALNIHRSPLCGRNFEYYSEDPLISGRMAAACVRGIQSQHIAACVKHFCCNNKETNRKWSDSRVSERALREIYLRGFEIAVKEAQPWSLMTSYNLVNGTYPSENRELLEGILREEWGYLGVVTTDWNNDAEHFREVRAGNDIRMPSGSKKRLQKALEYGYLTRAELEKCAARVLELLCKFD